MTLRWLDRTLARALLLAAVCAGAAAAQDLRDVSAKQLRSQGGPAAASGRAVDGFDKDAVPVDGCGGSEAAMLREAAASAREIAVGCLIGSAGRPGLNPALGELVRGYLGQGGLKLSCADKSGSALGWSSHSGSGGRTDVTIVTWPPREIVSRKPDDTPWVLFHELLHAVDGDSRLLLSHRIHQQTAAPDGVYSCEYACRGLLLDGFSPIRLESFENVSRLVIPPTQVPCRAGDPAQCAAVSKFATICARGPVRTPEFARVEKPWTEAFCALLGVQGKSASGKKGKACTEAPCLELLDEGVSASQRQGDIQRPLVAALERLTNVFEAADRGAAATLEPKDKTLYDALDRSGVVSSCRDADED